MNECRRIMVLVAVAAFGAHSLGAQPPSYRMTKLGTLGGADSTPYEINSSGHIVGSSRIASGHFRGFLWQGSGLETLATFGGQSQASATAVNDVGLIAGYALTADGVSLRAVTYQNGGIQDLGFAGFPRAVNNLGQIVGWAPSSGGFLYDSDGSFHIIDGGGQANDINNLGDVVGYFGVSGGPSGSRVAPYLYRNGVIQDIGDPTWPEAQACAINDSGQVTGVFRTASNLEWRLFFYENGSIQDMGPMFAPCLTVLNNVGDVVWVRTGPGGLPELALSKAGTVFNLSSLITNAGDDVSYFNGPLSMNDSGQISAVAVGGGIVQAVRLDPEPPPSEPPVITDVTGPTGPLEVGAPVVISASFTSGGLFNSSSTTGALRSTSFTTGGLHSTLTCTIDWGDGTASAGTVDASRCSGQRTYGAAGVYTVRVTVTDAVTGSASRNSDFVVIYDASAGFVTGGGWINSTPGALTSDPSAAGKADFGFVARYQRGANVPSGNTQFQFHVANFNFRSSAYEWLVVAGAKAQFKGSGVVNGIGNYGFLLTATDGAQPGGRGVDQFRIKIWDRTTDVIVYDNVRGASDDPNFANPQALSGGSIVIHAQ
ncbi:MAG: hypothetical protein JNN08_15400 [Bryobacterales bacterium]|nr:hypothetical protein [Bryobacterales bacterium]